MKCLLIILVLGLFLIILLSGCISSDGSTKESTENNSNLIDTGQNNISSTIETEKTKVAITNTVTIFCNSNNCKNLEVQKNLLIKKYAELSKKILLSFDMNCVDFYTVTYSESNFNGLLQEFSEFNLKLEGYNLVTEEINYLSMSSFISQINELQSNYNNKSKGCEEYYNNLIVEFKKISLDIVTKIEDKNYGLFSVNEYSDGSCTKMENDKLNSDLSDLKDANVLLLSFKEKNNLVQDIKCKREHCFFYDKELNESQITDIEESISSTIEIVELFLKLCNS